MVVVVVVELKLMVLVEVDDVVKQRAPKCLSRESHSGNWDCHSLRKNHHSLAGTHKSSNGPTWGWFVGKISPGSDALRDSSFSADGLLAMGSVGQLCFSCLEFPDQPKLDFFPFLFFVPNLEQPRRCPRPLFLPKADLSSVFSLSILICLLFSFLLRWNLPLFDFPAESQLACLPQCTWHTWNCKAIDPQQSRRQEQS